MRATVLNLSRRRLRIASMLLAILTTPANCSVFRSVLPAEYPGSAAPADEREETIDHIEMHWIGHATVLLRVHDRWILTDPCFSTYLGPVKRYIEPSLTPRELPELDWVLISHTHLDHLDRSSLKAIPRAKNLLTPAGGRVYIPGVSADRIVGVNNGVVTEDNGVRVTAVPAQHFGGRFLIDNLWDGEPYTGYVIEYKDTAIYFAGDTGYHPELFQKIGERFDLDLVLMPMGPTRGNSGFRTDFGKYVHVNPAEAVQAFADTNARWMVPIHHSTFYRRGGSEMAAIQAAIAGSSLRDRIYLARVGERIAFDPRTNRVARLSRGESLAENRVAAEIDPRNRGDDLSSD